MNRQNYYILSYCLPDIMWAVKSQISSNTGISRPIFNHRVTHSKSLNNARSESSITVNPRNPYNIVAASKRFTNPAKYEFSLAVYTTFDGGCSWHETSDLKFPSEWKAAGTSDPALAWDVSQD